MNVNMKNWWIDTENRETFIFMFMVPCIASVY